MNQNQLLQTDAVELDPLSEEQLDEIRARTDGDLMMQVVCKGEVIWSHGYEAGCRQGMTQRGFRETGVMDRILTALELACIEARGQ